MKTSTDLKKQFLGTSSGISGEYSCQKDSFAISAGGGLPTAIETGLGAHAGFTPVEDFTVENQLADELRQANEIIAGLQRRIYILEYENQERRRLQGIPELERGAKLLNKENLPSTFCSGCPEKAKKSEMAQELSEKNALIVHLNQLVSQLTEKLGVPRPDSTNSGTSSSKDPLSSNAEKERKAKQEAEEGPKRPRGGQRGHPAHFRMPFRDDEDAVRIEYSLDSEISRQCPHCGADLERESSKDQRHDRYSLPEILVNKEIHNQLAYRCKKCGEIHYPPIPREVDEGGLFHSGLVALTVMLNAVDKLSVRGIQKHLKNVHNVNVTHSFVEKCLKKATLTLRPVYLEALDHIKYEKKLNADETSHPHQDKKLYDWVFVSSSKVVHVISDRSSSTLEKVLSDIFEGVIGSDCYAVYIVYAKNHPGVTLQLCMAHLIRDFNHCSQYPDKDVKEYGDDGQRLVREIIHNNNILKKMDDKESADAIALRYKQLELKNKLIEHAANPKVSKDKAVGISKRFREYPEYYFTFMDHPDIEPTNNGAERAIRSPVIARKISLFTQSTYGIWAREVFWTITATLDLLKMDIKDYLTQAFEAYWEKRPLPSIVNIGKAVDEKYVEQARQEQKRQKEVERDRKKGKAENKNGVRPFTKGFGTKSCGGKTNEAQHYKLDPEGSTTEKQPPEPDLRGWPEEAQPTEPLSTGQEKDGGKGAPPSPKPSGREAMPKPPSSQTRQGKRKSKPAARVPENDRAIPDPPPPEPEAEREEPAPPPAEKKRRARRKAAASGKKRNSPPLKPKTPRKRKKAVPKPAASKTKRREAGPSYKLSEPPAREKSKEAITPASKRKNTAMAPGRAKTRLRAAPGSSEDDSGAARTGLTASKEAPARARWVKPPHHGSGATTRRDPGFKAGFGKITNSQSSTLISTSLPGKKTISRK